MPRRRLAIAALCWATIYILTGVLSLSLDEPSSRASYVWLPAGVALAALMLHGRRSWAGLLAVFFVAQIALGLWHGDPLPTALVLGLNTCISQGLAAWLITRWTPDRTGVSYAGALVGTTMVASLLSALIGGGWIVWHEQVDPTATIAVWAMANAAGTLVVTPMIIAWSHFRARRSGGPKASSLIWGLVILCALLASTYIVFDGNLADRYNSQLALELTYIPMFFAVVLAAIWGPRGGSIGILALTLLSLDQTAQDGGPFIFPGDPAGAGLLHTQAYLTIVALLIVLINAIRLQRDVASADAVQWQERFHSALAASQQVFYQFDTSTRQLSWGGDTHTLLGHDATALDHADTLYPLVHPDDRERVRQAWQSRAGGDSQPHAIVFRFADDQGQWRTVVDNGAGGYGLDDHPATVIGTWQVTGLAA